MNTHTAHSYILNPVHPVTITLIGTGGTGSHVLSALARLHTALLALGHPGLMVTAFDGDIVTPANLGRQMFSGADLGQNKAVVLITRINRYFGLSWRAIAGKFTTNSVNDSAIECPIGNFVISCVDSLQARRMIRKTIQLAAKNSKKKEVYKRPFYWMDFGNGQSNAQFVLSTLQDPNPTDSNEIQNSLPDVFTLFPKMITMKDDPETVSCSMHEAFY